MGSDFPLDHKAARYTDSQDEDEVEGFFCYVSDSDDADEDSNSKKNQSLDVPAAMPALDLGPMLLSKDETKDEKFLASVCMEDGLEFIDYRFEGRGTVNGIVLCLCC